jgi:hypothetical protein
MEIAAEDLKVLKANDIHNEFYEFILDTANSLYQLYADRRHNSTTYHEVLNDICKDFNKCQMKWIDNFCNRNWMA